MKSQTNATPRSVIPRQQVVVGVTPVRLSVPNQSDLDHSGVRLEREGDIVRAIEVTCSCGERIRLLCEYESTPDIAHQQSLDKFEKYNNANQVNGMPGQ
jgi:hypothetical protein